MTRESRFNRGELKAVGRQLRLLRIARGWSLKKLSDMSGVSIAAIRKVEFGRSNPSLLTVLALVEALDEPVDRLISEVLRHGSNKVQLVRAAERETDRSDVALSNALPGRQMTGHRLALGPDQTLAAAAGGFSRPVFGYVVEGTIVLSQHEGDKRACSRGDAFHILQPERDTVSAAADGAELVLIEDGENAP